MGFVECIGRERAHLIEDLVGNFFADAIGDTTHTFHRAVVFFRTVNEVIALFFHDIVFFLGHGTAHQVRTTVGIARQLAANLHNLLLIDDTAVSNIQNILQQRCFIGNLFWIVTVADITRNGIHWTWAVQRNDRDQILHRFRLQLNQHLPHSRRLELEYTLRLTF